VNADGSGLRRISEASESAAWVPIWSPSGDRLAYSSHNGETRIVEVDKGAPGTLVPVHSPFIATSWSPDGKRLAGSSDGIAVYDIDTQSTEKISPYGRSPSWLKDSKRLVFYDDRKIYLVDVPSGKPREIATLGTLTANGRPSVSPDGRYLYLSLTSAEADIWLVSLE